MGFPMDAKRSAKVVFSIGFSKIY